ncbi:MAG TPA: flavodoxin domain-containing protein [Solirubrobacteraceae bacterium]|nr:flavodoxin domain-containing protein [Solirubrobacteraceae bacterium]
MTASAAPVLVAYASKHEATAEIAQRIAAAMREAGCAAEARPASEVRDLSGYRAVVLGSAVYANRWRPAARTFARRHVRALRDMPVWLFSSGPLGSVDEHPTAPMPPLAERLMARLDARECVMFGGRVPLDPGNFIERAMAKNTPPERSDARDWPAIEAWARGVAAQLDAEAQLPSGGRTAPIATRG